MRSKLIERGVSSLALSLSADKTRALVEYGEIGAGVWRLTVRGERTSAY
jgi:hypothetical protein